MLLLVLFSSSKIWPQRTGWDNEDNMEKPTVGKIKELWEKWVTFTGLSICLIKAIISHTQGNERAWNRPNLIQICCSTANSQRGIQMTTPNVYHAAPSGFWLVRYTKLANQRTFMPRDKVYPFKAGFTSHFNLILPTVQCSLFIRWW